MQRRLVDTARHSDRRQWERLAGRALEFPPPYHPVPGIPVYHVAIGDRVILIAEHDLGGPALNLVTAVMALVLQQHFVVISLSSLVVAGSGALLVTSAPAGPVPGDSAAGPGGDQVCQETADLAEREVDEAAARAFGALAAVTAR
jgi:hypothetical protein